MAALSDDELAAKTGELRHRIEAAGLGGPDPGSSPAEILSGSGDGSYASPGGSSRERRRTQAAEWRRRGLLSGLPEDVVIEGFAVVREAAHRVLGMRHYDVQLVRLTGVGAGCCCRASLIHGLACMLVCCQSASSWPNLCCRAAVQAAAACNPSTRVLPEVPQLQMPAAWHLTFCSWAAWCCTRARLQR